MRALRWPDAFPAGDLGLLRAAGVASARQLRDAAEAWRPWRSYAAMYLWATGNPVPFTNGDLPCLSHAASWYCHYSSPVGELVLTSDGEALTGLHLPLPRRRRRLRSPRRDGGAMRPRFATPIEQLRAYFAGERSTFDLPLRMAGTPFQRLAWDALLTIPFGDDHQLCGAGAADRPAGGLARRRGRQRPQPDRDHRPLPPGDRLRAGR